MGCCTLSCSSTKKTKETGIHNPKKGVGHWEKKGVVEVHDKVKLPKGEVPPAN